jgi:hypothetical protein
LSHAEVDLGQARLLDQVLMQLMEKIGEMWRDGDIRVAHEHMATAVIRNHVDALLASMRYPANAPSIVVATPAGQLHEAGALIVAVATALEGWRPIFLGSNLPADEIAGAVKESGTRAVALSLVFPFDDPKLPAALSRLNPSLPSDRYWYLPASVGSVAVRQNIAFSPETEKGPLVSAVSRRSQDCDS